MSLVGDYRFSLPIGCHPTDLRDFAAGAHRPVAADLTLNLISGSQTKGCQINHAIDEADGTLETNDYCFLGMVERQHVPALSPLAMSIGLITLIVGSTVVFAELQAALNHVWDVQAAPTRGMVLGLIRDRLLSFGLALAVVFLLLVSMVISAALAVAQAYLNQRMPGIPWLWRMLNTVVSFMIVSFLFALIYRYLPDVKITWRDVTIGSLFTAALFTIGKFVIGAYLGTMAFASSYGAAGSFVVLLIWTYYSALIFFFGAEFTQVDARRYGSRIRPQEHAVRVGRKSDET